eukprot:18933-Eustigmatos_ZCMA.PRE.1
MMYVIADLLLAIHDRGWGQELCRLYPSHLGRVYSTSALERLGLPLCHMPTPEMPTSVLRVSR